MKPNLTVLGLGGFGLAALLLLLAGCGDSGAPPQTPRRVLLVGIEGLDPQLVQEMVDEGELPHFARLLREGAHARLIAPDPLEPMQLWTTALTGKLPSKHRVVGELVRMPNTGKTVRTPSSKRQTKNLFQIAGDGGRTVAAVGFPGTWPAEVVNGTLAANGYTPHRWTETAEHTFDLDQVGLTTYPARLQQELEPFHRGVADLERETVARFFTFNESEFRMLYDEPLGSIFRKENPPRDFGLTLQSDRTNLDVIEHLMELYRPRLAAVHLQLPAAVQPVWWFFSRGEIYDVPRDSRRRLGRAVPETYRWLDEQVGRLWDDLGEDDALVVVSPVGFGDLPAPEGAAAGRELVPGPTHEGGLWMAGPAIEAGARSDRGEVDDLTPTVLALMDLDVGGDMDGRVLRELLVDEYLRTHPVTMTESHDSQWDPSRRYPSDPRSKPPNPSAPGDTLETEDGP